MANQTALRASVCRGRCQRPVLNYYFGKQTASPTDRPRSERVDIMVSNHFYKSMRVVAALFALLFLTDLFWRTKRPADVTVRLEYRQEKLHAHVQAQEISYPNVHGARKTEFKVVGDDYFDDGRVIAWRCLLIENGKIVAETQSYSWD